MGDGGVLDVNRLVVAALETHLYRVPPAVPWQDATATVGQLEFLVLRLHTESGLTGDGLAYSVGVGASATRSLLEDYCRPAIVGLDAQDFERNWLLLSDLLHRTGSGGTNTLAIAAFDIAAWDLLAKSRGIPMYRMIGGARSSIPAYRSGIDLHLSAVDLGRRVAEYVAEGFDAIKIKVGRPTIREDVERIGAAREVIGPDRQLMLDANQAWTVDEAVRRLAAFEPFHPAWIEEPIRAEDVAGHARLRQTTTVPIALGESLYSRFDFLNYLRADAVDILQPDVARVGGITEWLKIAHLAEAWGRRVAPHFLQELSVHLLCGVSNGLILESVEGGGLAEVGLLPERALISDGWSRPTEVPGHGLSFDIANLSQFEV